MIADTFDFIRPDNVALNTLKWIPENRNDIKAVLQIVHGMAEHAERYDEFASYLMAGGIACYANDLRGHGKSAPSIEDIGFFADNNGWQTVLEDIYALTKWIEKEHPGVPVFLFGHSMGSFFLRNYISVYGDEINGAIISGTSGDPGIEGIIGKWIANIEKRIRGKRHRSQLLNFLSFKSFNKQFRPNRTEFDWLSRDEKVVDAYIEDPFCGGIFTSSFFCDLLQGVLDVNQQKNIDKVPKSLPVYFFSGGSDPVGNNSKGIRKTFDRYKNSGIKDIRLQIYEGGRHEMLNEINKEDVFRDVLDWIRSKITT